MPLMEANHPSLSSNPSAAHNPDRNAENKGEQCFFGRVGFDLLILHKIQQTKA